MIERRSAGAYAGSLGRKSGERQVGPPCVILSATTRQRGTPSSTRLRVRARVVGWVLRLALVHVSADLYIVARRDDAVEGHVDAGAGSVVVGGVGRRGILREEEGGGRRRLMDG